MSGLDALLADPALAPILLALPQARLVGGCVRDTLAGRPVADIDLAAPDPPDRAQAALERAGLRVIPTGLGHGTLTAISQGRPFEVTTLRRDEATDGRHARVAWTSDFQEDAARRDFTINAMSLDRDGRLHDYFGGVADLAAGRVRFVGEPGRRIAEDYLRILRFFRFSARYAAGAPDGAVAAAITAGTPGLVRLSAERIWSELKRILEAPAPGEAVRWMQELGVLAAVLPEAVSLVGLECALQAGAPPDPVLRLAALLGSAPGRAAARLRLSAAEADRLARLGSGAVPGHADDDDALRRMLADEPADVLAGRVWLAGGDATLRARVTAAPRPVFPLEGRDALALGASPGPAVGEALRQTRSWWLAGGCRAGADELRVELARRLGK